jgi:hypothetical protein
LAATYAGRDDDAATVGNVRDRVFEHVEGAEDVDVQGVGEDVRGVVHDLRDLTAGPRVAEHDVVPAVVAGPHAHRLADGRLVGDVGDRADGVGGPELLDGGREPRLVESHEMHARTLGDEQPCGRQSDTTLAAGDQGDLAPDNTHRGASSCRSAGGVGRAGTRPQVPSLSR